MHTCKPLHSFRYTNPWSPHILCKGQGPLSPALPAETWAWGVLGQNSEAILDVSCSLTRNYWAGSSLLAWVPLLAETLHLSSPKPFWPLPVFLFLQFKSSLGPLKIIWVCNTVPQHRFCKFVSFSKALMVYLPFSAYKSQTRTWINAHLAPDKATPGWVLRKPRSLLSRGTETAYSKKSYR